MEKSSNKSNSGLSKVKKYIPFILLILLTIALMFFFKYKKRDISRMIEASKNNLLTLAQNLKPLLFQTNITDEDVFNFALYQSLPLDKEKNKVLVISNDGSNNNVYEIKPASYNTSTNNYEIFAKYLGLNETQRKEADSILSSYKKEIYSSVLVNDKNTVAVNPKLVELQQAALADILSFAQKVNAAKTHDLFPQTYKFYKNDKVANMIVSAKETPQNEYILITPDTVARTHFTWNQEKFNRNMSELEKNQNINPPQIPDINFQFNIAQGKEGKNDLPTSESDYSYKIDSNLFKVVIPIETMNLQKMIADSIRIKLNEVAKKMKKISWNVPNTRITKQGPKVPPTPGEKENTQTKIIDPYEIVSKTMEMLSQQNAKSWEEYGAKMDSFARNLKFNLKDSLSRVKFKKDMKKWANELKKQKQFKNDSTKVK